ncbi:MAG: hypothetical protein Q4E24_01310 [bacterium]|nr:hypothetical protein [bacterium]
MFVNFTNHPKDNWTREQIEASVCYGEIVDVPFPEVSPESTLEQVRQEAEVYAEKIMQYRPQFVLCQGEFCMTYHVVQILKEKGIHVGAACSERKVTETTTESETKKTVLYQFVQYREY